MRDLRDDWQVWVAHNLLRGATDAAVIDGLVERGVVRADAAAAVAAARAHPYVRAAMPIAEALRRRDSLLRILAVPVVIPRRELDVDTFLREHYEPMRPVIVRHAIACPDLARHAAATVEIQDGRDADPRYQRDFDRTCTRTTLGALLDRIAATPASNDFYLTAKNGLLDHVPALVDELRPLPPFVTTTPRPGLWIGPAGTRTPLHFDWAHVAIAQLRGRKRFHLLPPTDAPRVDNVESRFADADVNALGAHEVVLEPGELLFVPVGWWHEAIALEPSVSVSLTGFVAPNAFAWDADTSR